MLLWRTYAYCEYLLAIKVSGNTLNNVFYYSRYIFGLRNADVRDPGHVIFFILFFLVGSPQLNAHLFAIKHKLLQPPKCILNRPQIPGKIMTEQTRYINPESGLLAVPQQQHAQQHRPAY